MFRILLFGGTTEGRKLAEFLKKNNIPTTVSVTTEYGAGLIGILDVLVGKLDFSEMKKLLQNNYFSLVIDATHPFAVLASKNIKSACEAENIRYLRLLRESGKRTDGIYFNSVQESADFLDKAVGNALITTGSKGLSAFCSVKNYAQRLTVRVLPAENIVEQCMELGFEKENIIPKKGPFSIKQNLEHLKKCSAKFLVTKESGAVGGFDEKAEAARLFSARLIIIKRPSESGFSLEEIENIIKAEFVK
ncbi:MAG: precorrin-6A reductase [Oscillospiraceae bacterium]|jgi:precorrin-6x reductase